MSEEQKELSVACQSLGDWTRTHTCGELTGADNGAGSLPHGLGAVPA